MAHGLDVVLDAAERQKRAGDDQTVYWIVGDGARRDELQQDANRRGLSNVRFLGQVAKPEVRNVLASCDACLVHLRGTELFGTVIPSKIFETMAMNTPIVMGVRGDAQRMVLDAGAGVAMEPDDPKSLIQGIHRIKTEPKVYAQGRDYVAKFYNRDVLAEKMLRVLRKYATPGSRQVQALPSPVQPSSVRKAA